MQLLYEENLRSLKGIQMESEKLQKKSDVGERTNEDELRNSLSLFNS